MSDTFVFGDIHNHVKEAQAFLNTVVPEKVIWLGDFIDAYKDTPADAKLVGKFLKKLISLRPQDVVIQGNHDTSYRFPTNEKYSKWGFSSDKSKAFDSEFPKELWSKFTLFHVEEIKGQKVVFSHAGFHPKFISSSIFDEQFLRRAEKLAFENGDKREYNPLLDSLFGPQWIRWKLPLFDGICQVVGHTPQGSPDIITSETRLEWNINLDCAKDYIGVFNETGFYSFNLKNGTRKLLI